MYVYLYLYPYLYIHVYGEYVYIQVLEAASANPTTVDTIKRFGGTTRPTVAWPE